MTERPVKKPSTPADPASTEPQAADSSRVEVALGLLEPKHRRALGPAWHLYLVLIARKPFGSPWVAGGRVVPFWVLTTATGSDERTVRRWLRRLERHGYVRTEYRNSGGHGDDGLRVRILKAKDWRRGAVRVHPDPRPDAKSDRRAADKSDRRTPSEPAPVAAVLSPPHRSKEPQQKKKGSPSA